MEYRLLGPIQLLDAEGRTSVPRGAKQRLLLAALLHDAPRIAVADRLIDTLWPRLPPADPAAALRTQASRLRSFLVEAGAADDVLRSEAYGYRLRVEPASVDSWRFQALLERADRTDAAADQLELLEEALALWRGEPFEEFAGLQIFLPELTRLRELRAGARERRVECLLLCGRTRDALASAEQLAREDPLRERPRALLMTALYEAGRQHEALTAFHDYRRTLSEELGLDPSPALRQLEADILRHEHVPRSPPVAATAAGGPPATEAVAREPEAQTPSDRSVLDTGAATVSPGPRPPLPLTQLIGREHERVNISRLLDSGRLVTLTGAGGSGKTRLAMEVLAQMHADAGRRVAWVGLEGLSDPRLLAQEVAAALGVREQPGRPVEDNLLRVLQAEDLLLCLDNCEHLIEACARLAESLLVGCPGLSILATSREPLGVRGELTWPVPPLPIPGAALADPDALRRFAAVELFCDRAAAANPSFRLTQRNAAAVAQICRRLDGMPLALELAAARLRTMPVEQLADRLDRRFHLLTAGSRTVLPRHQTLHAAIDWSYRLLSESERQLLDQLSVFSGDFGLEAVESICAADGERAAGRVLEVFMALVDKSLVSAAVDPDAARYRLLDTVRAFAREKLAARPDAQNLQRRHAEFFLQLAEEAEPHFLGPRRREWTARIGQVQDNLRAALGWTKATADAVSLHRRGTAALWWYWQARGQVAEARTWIDGALELPGSSADDATGATLLYGAAMARWLSGDLSGAARAAERALEAARSVGEARLLCRALGVSAWVQRDAGDFPAAMTLADEGARLARHGSLSRTELAFALWVQGSVHYTAGSLDVARAVQEEAVLLWRSEGVRWGLSQALHGLAIIALTEGELDVARRTCRAAITEIRDEGDVYWVCRGLEGLAAVEARQGALERAAHLLGAAEALREPMGTPLLAFEMPRYEQTVALLRERLSDVALATAWQRGRGLGLQRAVAYAVAGDSGQPLPVPP